MKNQYFGDQTDYIKFGILRTIARSSEQLAIHWTLTDDDGSSDGAHIKYLNAATMWRHYEPEIFDAIHDRVRNGDRRLKIVEELSFIPGAVQSFDKWLACPKARIDSIDALLDRISGKSVVFLDPDNGLETSSTKSGSVGASKYVFLKELQKIWELGHSIIVYQHYPRVQRVPYVRSQLDRLHRQLQGMNGAALLTNRVAFLACIQDAHRKSIATAFETIVQRWYPHVGSISFDGIAVSVSEAPAEQDPRQQEFAL